MQNPGPKAGIEWIAVSQNPYGSRAADDPKGTVGALRLISDRHLTYALWIALQGCGAL